MSDRYSQIVNAPVLSTVAKQVGLPSLSTSTATSRAAPSSRGRCSAAAPRAGSWSAR